MPLGKIMDPLKGPERKAGIFFDVFAGFIWYNNGVYRSSTNLKDLIQG